MGLGMVELFFYTATAEESAVHSLHIIQTFKSFKPSWFNIRVIVIDRFY